MRLDLGTGVVERDPAVRVRATGTVVEFDNLDFNFSAVDSGSCSVSWFDAGIKGLGRGNSDLMTSFSFPYCSAARDTTAGGPGGRVAVGFYEGYTTGGLTPSTTVGVFTLSGLPATTSSSSFFGRFNCFFVEVELDNLVPFADGPIGYSWKFLDLGSDGVLAATWPFLSCVASCSGPMDLGPPFQDNTLDRYSPPGFLRSTFAFGTAPSIGSIAMSIAEVSDCASTLVANTGQGLNLDILASPPAVVGQPRSADVVLGEPSHPPTGLLLLLFSTESLATGPRVSVFGGPVTELLIGPADLTRPCPTGSYSGGGGTLCPGATIPLDPALVGSPWCTQALVGTTGAGFTLTNSVCGTVGSL